MHEEPVFQSFLGFLPGAYKKGGDKKAIGEAGILTTISLE